MIDFSEFMEAATLTRPTGAYTNGYWVAGAATSSSIQVCVQPVTGRDLDRLPEGQRTQALVSLWSASSLALQDVVTIGADQYRLIHVEPWANLGSVYTKAIGVRNGH